MGCESCKDKISGVCKVCSLLENDNSVKIVTFCNLCGEYICQKCNGNLIDRFQAFLKVKLGL